MTAAHPWHQARLQALLADPARLPHALLLHGPEGIGKLDFALALANTLLCERPGPAGACGQCAACNWFEQGGHPDFKRIEPEALSADPEAGKKGGKHITIAEIRALGEFLSLAAHQGGWRVVVVHPAESMNLAAANALLKTLEEPPAKVMLILLAHQPRRLLPTVLSRCRKVPLSCPAPAEAEAWLRAQGVNAADSLLREAGGAPLLARGYADAERLARRAQFLDALAQATPAALFTLAHAFQGRVAEAWGWLVRWLHDLACVQADSEVRYFPDYAQPLRQHAQRLDPAALWHMHQAVVRDGRWLNHPLNGQLLLESWLIPYAENLEERHGR